MNFLQGPAQNSGDIGVDCRDNLLVKVVLLIDDFYLQAQFLPVHAGGGDGVLGVEAQESEDILAHIVGGCGGQGADRGRVHLGDEMAQAQVGGAEIMAPFRDAMGLIDGKETDGITSDGVRQFQLETFNLQAFWRDIEQFQLPRAQLGQHLLSFLGGLRAVDEFHPADPRFAEVDELVSHQGLQGTNYQGYPRQQHG